MLELFTISSSALCHILSAPLHELNSMQVAIRRALEEGNTPQELEAIRQAACIRDSLTQFSVTPSGRARRM